VVQQVENTQLSASKGKPLDVFQCQRRLRAELLDSPTIAHKPSRDLAAHMLLHLEDLDRCWGIATEWLCAALDCQRVDTGFGRPENDDYFPGFAEAKNTNYDVPSFGGSVVDNRDPIMQAMWSGSTPIVFADIKQDRRVTPKLSKRLSGAKTKSKFGAALRTRDGSFGLICADWTEHYVPNESGLYDRFEQTVSDVLSPVIAVARQISERNHPKPVQQHRDISVFHYGRQQERSLDTLTQSEIEIARLVAQGLSYKEIARVRVRALSTIDHQLRSLRKKMGVSSASGLVSLLSNIKGLSR